jgi:PEP-CTERM motif
MFFAVSGTPGTVPEPETLTLAGIGALVLVRGWRLRQRS